MLTVLLLDLHDKDQYWLCVLDRAAPGCCLSLPRHASRLVNEHVCLNVVGLEYSHSDLAS